MYWELLVMLICSSMRIDLMEKDRTRELYFSSTSGCLFRKLEAGLTGRFCS
jgi:hypothetical protein